MAKLLIVDDDGLLTTSLENYLSGHGYTVETCADGSDAVQLMKTFGYDLIILDWTLPGQTGEQICREYRASGGQTPVLFLTGKGDVDSLETAFDCGADDYISKPFNVRELHARLKTLLKRRTGTFSAALVVDGLTLDPEKGILTCDGQIIKLRAKESAMLEYLMRNPNKIFGSQQLFDAVWPSDTDSSADAVRTWMAYLRHKLAAVGRPDFVKTKLGAGYLVETEAQ